MELNSETIRKSVSKLIKKLRSVNYTEFYYPRFYTKKQLEDFAEVGFLDLTLEEIEKADESGFIKTHSGIAIYLARKVYVVTKK